MESDFFLALRFLSVHDVMGLTVGVMDRAETTGESWLWELRCEDRQQSLMMSASWGKSCDFEQCWKEVIPCMLTTSALEEKEGKRSNAIRGGCKV